MLETFQVNNYSFSNYQVLNDNLCSIDYNKQLRRYKETTIDPALAYRYQGNFYGLLRELNIKTKDYFYILYINGYTSPTEFDGKKIVLNLI